MKRLRLLFKIGFVYHKAAFDPVIELFQRDDRYDVFFALDEERVRRFFINFRHRPAIVDQWVREGYRFTGEKSGFDIVIAGDTVSSPEAYGRTLLCFLNHGTGIKNILYRNLSHQQGTRYQIFVEGRYRVERIRESGFQGKSEVHLIGLPKLDWYFQGRYADRAGLLRRWGLDPERPTVLFAPTYKPTCMYDVQDAIFTATESACVAVIYALLVVLLTRRGGEGISGEERQRRLDGAVGSWIAQGWAVENQTADSAVLRRGGDLMLVTVDQAGHVSTRPLPAA